MKLLRHIIHKDRYDFSEYGENEQFVREIAYTIQLKTRISGGWTIERVINEAFQQATVLLFDFSSPIFFEADYYKDAAKDMPMNVANAVFSVVYLLLRDDRNMKNVTAMIENTLRSKPIFNALKAIAHPSSPICLYPQTEYFCNSQYINWKKITNNFQPKNIQRILDIAENYPYQDVVAEGILGQLRAFALETSTTTEQNVAEAERLLRSYVSKDRVWNIYAGDEITQCTNFGFNGAVVEVYKQDPSGDSEKLKAKTDELKQVIEERNTMRERIAKLEEEEQERLRETEEYKTLVADMKAQLGQSHISFQKIADCILRLPTYDSQYTAFQQVNALLTGTAWQEKAEDVLNQMFARVKQQTPDVKIAIKEFHNHEGGQYIDQSQTINIANPETPKLTE